MAHSDTPAATSHRILLGISGGIAAYKAAELARLLVKAGYDVRVVMTQAATQFIGTLTLQTITGTPVATDIFDPQQEAAMGHIALARWADLIVIAPASANCIARLYTGQADTLLHTICLASTAPLAIAPAMNTHMWQHPATQANIRGLRQRGVLCWGPADGTQACGETGPGRLSEPTELYQHIVAHFARGSLTGCHLLLTAGPTREPLDAVRYIGNRSSGKMGYAIATAAVEQGARVTLISGPTALACPAGVTRHQVQTAQQMYDQVMDRIAQADIFVACAAVADYRPETCAERKIKKGTAPRTLTLVPNPDILAAVAALPAPPYCLGFAAETDQVLAHAETKRQAKNIPLLAANQVSATTGFDADENALTLLSDQGQIHLPQQPKPHLARQLIHHLAEHYHAHLTVQNS
ncbi:MAG: bifunctional phosphopantothenoylcysteine decarboxylase/phosphopantothenate--cysteine ligase CoaBC [Pseudomonadota bacterium]